MAEQSFFAELKNRKVVRTALQDAASVASLLLTTEAIVTEAPKKPARAAAPDMGDMDF